MPQVETTAYEYDAQNRPIAVHTFSSVATNGISHFYRYDARGRRSEYKVELEAESAGSQRTIAQYGYDANSNLTALKLGLNAPGDTTLRTEFVYDARNRLTGKESFNRFGTKVSECVYSYFANSNLAARAEFHLPMQGETNAWEATFKHSYDGANCLTRQWQEVSEPLDTMVLYEPIAPEVRAKHRLRLKAGFDTRTVMGTGASGTGVKFRGRISANAYAPPLVLAEGYLAMDYDDFGRIMRLLRYDGKGRVIDSLTYQYLNNTGRLGHVRDGVGSAVTGNDVDNQMPNNYAYDASGNMTQDVGSGIGEIRYNQYNLPTTLIKSGQTYQYRYDGSGKRIEKVQPNGSFESYRRGANGELFAIYDNVGGLKQFELDGIGEMRVEGGQWRAAYYDKDIVGNNRMVIKQDGAVARTFDPDVWGYEEKENGDAATTIEKKFANKERDKETGWDNFGARYYRSGMGVWNGADEKYWKYPFVSPYSYGLNNPLRYVDVDGRDIIVLLAPSNAMYAGHMAVLIGNNQTGWNFYSKNGGEYWLSGASIEKQNFPIYNINNLYWLLEGRYDRGYWIETDAETDLMMKEAAGREVDEDYALIGNSCRDVCVEALRAGRFDVFGLSVIPNVTFSQIRRRYKGKLINIEDNDKRKDRDNESRDEGSRTEKDGKKKKDSKALRDFESFDAEYAGTE